MNRSAPAPVDAEQSCRVANPAHEGQPQSVASPEWLRADNMLYTLTQDGWRAGKPVMVNRLMVMVHWDHRYASDEEGEALIRALHQSLRSDEASR